MPLPLPCERLPLLLSPPPRRARARRRSRAPLWSSPSLAFVPTRRWPRPVPRIPFRSPPRAGAVEPRPPAGGLFPLHPPARVTWLFRPPLARPPSPHSTRVAAALLAGAPARVKPRPALAPIGRPRPAR
nr:translation initiation factor IF-2-like [Aegilops tauschii subsp. strangulata]XP_040249633.1 translation initiation factor IF-2-like [Aegilops tauschii subsp. strangulata]XP_040253615.1 translation initiation factor IF-2-like [Aegilops tauschii subsp. strangulata]